MSLPTAQTVEIQWSGSTWTDVTAWLEQRFDVEAKFGRSSPTGDVQPATLTFTLDNRDGRFTPGNPAGAYWPDVALGKAVRWKVTGGDATARTEFVGRIQAFEPGFDGDAVAGSVVTVSAADGLAAANRLLEDYAVELARSDAATSGFDAWQFADRDGATSLRNAGDGDGGTFVPYGRVGASLETGTAAVGGSPDGLASSGMISFTPTNAVCPVAELPVSVAAGTVNGIEFWFRTTTVPSGNATLAEGWTAGKARPWEIQLIPDAGATSLQVKDLSGTVAGTYPWSVNDGLWRHVWLANSGGATDMYVAVFGGGGDFNGVYVPVALAMTGSIQSTAHVVVGGNMVPVTGRGAQNRCCTADVAQVIVSGNLPSGHGEHGLPLSPLSANLRLLNLAGAVNVSLSTTGAGSPDTAIPDVPGRSLAEVMQEVARTVGGVAWVKPDGTVQWRNPSAVHPGTPVLTVDVEADCEGSPTLAAGVDTRPTRVAVSSPAGDVVVVSAAEGTQIIEDSIDTCALTVAQARNAGELRLAAGNLLRVESLTVNLATATADLWADAYGLYPGARVRVAGLPSAVLGWTYQDYYVVGWAKRTVAAADGAADGQWLTFDLEPAVNQAEAGGSLATAGAGGSGMTATAGTIAGTGTGTLVVTTVSGPTLSTDAANYPQDFSWYGERVTVTSAPGGSTSPQTVTVTARGVAPSVARTHGSGEPFDVFDPALAGI